MRSHSTNYSFSEAVLAASREGYTKVGVFASEFFTTETTFKQIERLPSTVFWEFAVLESLNRLGGGRFKLFACAFSLGEKCNIMTDLASSRPVMSPRKHSCSISDFFTTLMSGSILQKSCTSWPLNLRTLSHWPEKATKPPQPFMRTMLEAGKIWTGF